MKLPFIKRTGLASLVIVALAVGAVGTALAAFPDTNVDTFTGCLDRAGLIERVDAGPAPLRPCGPVDRLVHLSGGDITKVTAGPGLTGGGDNGAVTLAVDPRDQLPRNCTNGQAPKQSAGTWACGNFANAGQSCSTGSFTDGVGPDGSLTCSAPPGPTTFTATGDATIDPSGGAVLATLSLPAGSYFFILTGNANNNDTGNIEGNCQMIDDNTDASFGAFEIQTELTSVQHAVIPFSASGFDSSSRSITARVQCQVFSSNNTKDFVHFSLRMTALAVGTVNSQ
jgi:hypothetical protein